MKKLFFVIHNVIQYITYNKFVSTTLMIAMILGFTFPLMALNDVNDLLKDGTVSKYTDAAGIKVIDYFMQFKTADEINGVIKMGKEEGVFEEAGFCIVQGQIVYAKNESYACGISGISDDYLTLSSCELLEGELFSEKEFDGNGEKVCLLEHQNILVRQGMRVGDNIEILGDVYKIKGIIHAPRIYGGVLVPYQMSTDLFSGSNSLTQYQFITYGNEDMKPTSLARYLFKNQYVISAQTGTEQEKAYYESIKEVNKKRLLRASLVILFAIANIYLVFVGMLMRERYSLTIHYALGATLKTIQLELFIRNIFLILLSFFISILIYPIISGLVVGANRFLQMKTMLQVGFGGVVFVALISYLIPWIYFDKQDMSILLKK
jgi:hypothetical protein